MAAATGTSSPDDIISDINITPMVDIVLVLLIIFMVTSALIVDSAIKVDLPRAANAVENPPSTLALVLTKQGALYLNGSAVSWEELSQKVQDQQQKEPALQAVISADKDVSHGQVIHLIDVIKGLGIAQFALNIEQVEYDGQAGAS